MTIDGCGCVTTTQETLVTDVTITQETLVTDVTTTQETLVTDVTTTQETLVTDVTTTQETLVTDVTTTQETLVTDQCQPDREQSPQPKIDTLMHLRDRFKTESTTPSQMSGTNIYSLLCWYVCSWCCGQLISDDNHVPTRIPGISVC